MRKFANTTERELYRKQRTARILAGLLRLIRTDPPRVVDTSLVQRRVRAGERLLKELDPFNSYLHVKEYSP